MPGPQGGQRHSGPSGPQSCLVGSTVASAAAAFARVGMMPVASSLPCRALLLQCLALEARPSLHAHIGRRRAPHLYAGSCMRVSRPSTNCTQPNEAII